MRLRVVPCRYGFNPGSANGIVGKSAVVATAAVNTTISAAAGCLTTLLAAMVNVWGHSRMIVWDLLVAGNGALAGLVSITASCAGRQGGAIVRRLTAAAHSGPLAAALISGPL
jgi:Amt family ammonium transporter